jgi:tetratricopeptide (TPR) repeat protein
MRIVEALCAISLRPLLETGGPSAADFWGKQWSETQVRSCALLQRAADHAWRTLEVAVAGPAWWERCKILLRPGEDTAIGERVQVFLDSAPLAEPAALGVDWRRKVLADFPSARQRGLLFAAGVWPPWQTVQGAIAAGQDKPDADMAATDRIAQELRQAGLAALADVLAERATGAALLLAAAAHYFVRREIVADAELSGQLTAAGLSLPAAEAPTRFDALGDVLAAHTPRLEALLATLVGGPAETTGYPLDIEREMQGRDEEVATLARAVLQALERRGLRHRELRLSDSGMVRGVADRERIHELVAQSHALDPEQQRSMPALLNGLAMLEAAAGDYEAAHHDFQTAAAAVVDPHALAILEYNAYVAALEQHDWAEALALLERAATLWPERFSPFPLSKYEPERILGVGGSGVSFLCRHRPSDSHVVVKTLWPDGLLHDAAEVFREAQLVEQLDHPTIVHLRDCDYADSEEARPYLVTDYFEGLSLAEYVAQNGPLAAHDWLRVARPVAEVLQTAHDKGILHRDIKPANILFRTDEQGGWRIKLIDFGLGLRPTALHGTLTSTAVIGRSAVGAGTAASVPYAAPEVIGWVEGVPLGAYSDVYSFGKTSYFALLGTPEPDDEEKATLSPSWRRVLGHCTARSIARRPPNFRVVLQQLAHMQAAAAAEGRKEATEAGEASPGLPRADRERVLDLVNKGMALKQHGDYERAIAAFTRALQIDPNLAGAYIKRGNVHSDQGDYDRAIADYTAAVRVEPKNALAYQNRGLAHAKKGDFDAVLADCEKALALDPKLASAHFIRATAYSSKGDRQRAITEFNLALRLDPKNALAYNGRGMTHADAEDYDKSIADYTAALRLEPKLTLAYVNRGIAYRLKGNPERAIKEFTTALRLEPRNVPALFNRGLAFADRQLHQNAAADFERVLVLDPRHPEAAERREETIKARKAASGAPVPRRPALPSRAEQDALRLARAKNNQEEERRQVRAAAYFARGRSFIEQKDYNQAVDQFTKAIQMDPRDALAYYNRGLAYVAQSEYQEAIADYTSALHLNPKNALAFYHRGIAHRHLSEFDRAIADYTRAIRLDPRLAVAYRNRGHAFAAKGDSDRARADYEEAVRLDPSLAKK